MTADPSASDVYRIEKERIATVLTLTGRRSLSGHVFVQPYSSRRGGPEHPLDVLNNADPFLPFVIEGGQTIVVAKAHIVEARFELPAADRYQSTGVPDQMVELSLAGGLLREGRLLIEARSESPRVLEVLNQMEQRFFFLLAADGARFLNREHVEFVRLLD